MRIRYYIDPVTGLPHIYNHGISEEEVEAVLSRPVQDLRGRDDSRIAMGQTDDGRYLRVIYVPHDSPKSLSVVTAYELGPKAKHAHSTQAEREEMKNQNYPKGWSDARIQRVIKHYDSQSDAEVAAEIEAASKTLMEIPTALVSDVRELIAKRRSTRARRRVTGKRGVQRNKARTA